MGTYFNIGNAGFQRARNSEYVDKSGLIVVVNSTLFTECCFSCVTRCRCFGKSKRAQIERGLVTNEITSRASRDYVSSLTTLRLVVLMLLMMVLGVSVVKAKIDDGHYYIKSNANQQYFLCPAIGCYYDNNVDQPHLTTFQTNKDQNSVWEIKFVETVNSVDYYYMIHYKTGKYLRSNEGFDIDGSYGHRKAIHLEEKPSSLDDTFMFCIKNNSGTYQIYPKNYSYKGTSTDASGWSFNPRGNNQAYYVPQNGLAMGIIGLSGSSDASSKWILESVADALKPCATPIIKYDGDNINISYPYSDETGITIYYTTDGSAPTTSSSHAESKSFNISANDVIKVRAFATKTGLVNSDEAVLWGSERPFLIQSKENANYFLVPAGNGSNVNTSSIASEAMQWTLQNAGSSTGGVPYYYLVNSNGKKVKYNADYSLTMDNGSDNANKFCIIENGKNSGFFFIIPVGGTSTGNEKFCRGVFKNAGNVDKANTTASQIKADNNDNINRVQWVLKVCNDGPDQKDLFPAPNLNYIVSEGDVATYYNIQNLNVSDHYIIPPSVSDGYATTSNSGYENTPWILMKAASDNWLTYYYIINAASLKYMYYSGDLVGTDNQSNAISMKETPTDDGRCQFVLVPSTTEGAYYIVPKGYMTKFTNNNFFGLWYDDDNPATLRMKWSRSSTANNVKWKFVAHNDFIAPPFITFSANDMKVVMKASTQDFDGIKYDYTVGTADAPLDAMTDYPVGGIDVKHGPVYHFAAKTQKGANYSLVNKKDIDLSYIEVPTIEVSGSTVTFSTSQKGMTFYYTTDGSTPKYTDKNAGDNHGTPIASNSENKAVVTLGAGLYDLRVIAVSIMDDADETGYSSSASDVKTIDLRVLTDIYSLADIQSQTGLYKMTSTFSATGTPKVDGTGDEIGTASKPFKGTIQGYWDDANGAFKTISLSKPLFECIEDATIRDVIVAKGDISGNGAIAAVAKGQARIYNCGYLGGTITGSGNVGGIVGEIQDAARVINCYSFATVSGGSLMGGIVGNNNVTTASKKGSINTMVMNCMFYGTIDGGGAPVYNGTIISNAGADGLNNFNYYSFDDFQGTPSPYNCALAAEKIYLERFEFHRNILNSNRELAAWYATGSVGNSGEMAKWVLDKSIAKYPILKRQGYYPSVINYEDAPSSATISISVSQGNGAPSGASIGSCPARKIYDKDIEHHHYNHKTIRLPYYSEVGGTGNYTNYKVMTGWEVTVSGGKNFTGTFTHNYANRDYSAYSGRVFSQGAYLDIPEGATSVSITSHWADCVYLSDPTYDVTYSTDYNTPTYVDDMGTRYGGEKKFNGQDVYTTFNDALEHLDASSGTVYDHAIVMVGNYHQYCKATAMANSTKLFTVMSADLNNDCEPDYSFFYQHTQRHQIAPVRFDFLNFPGIGLGQKVEGTGNMAAQGIFQPKGWFEITNTCLVHFTQFEYDLSKNIKTPVILLGGIYDQFVSGNTSVGGTSYIHLGSNVYFPNEFCNGTHGDQAHKTPHIPISVTGGEFKDFYLSGMFNPAVEPNADNAICYIDGGYFSEEVAGAGQEKIDGNVTWYIANADITNFYGGGINDAKSITGNITVNIKNSRVDQYCGGPKFGNMSNGKIITTTATDKCVFGKFFGAGYGGTSLYQRRTQNDYKKATYSWSTWAGEYDTAFDGGYNATYHGVPTSYKYEYVDRSGAEDNTKVGRFYINYASLSLAVTHDVESTLTDCTIKSDFFGGGNLGMVNGDIESTLTDCTVHGSVFGGGFSATPPTVDVWPKNSFGSPGYNPDAGVYISGNYPDTAEEGMVVYTWSHDKGSASSPLTKDGNNYWIYTAKDTENNKDLGKLGQVTGDVKLTIDGGTKVGKILHGIWDKTQNKLVVDTNNEKSSEGGGVFGGGDSSAILGSTLITLKDNAEIAGNVFGGGNEADVSGSTTVNIEQ